jgi:hypothetical protein
MDTKSPLGLVCTKKAVDDNKIYQQNLKNANQDFANIKMAALNSNLISNDGKYFDIPAIGENKYYFTFINGNRIQRADTKNCIGVAGSKLSNDTLIEYQGCGNDQTQKWRNPIAEFFEAKRAAKTDFLTQNISYYKKKSEWTQNVCSGKLPKSIKQNCYKDDIPINSAYDFPVNFPYYFGTDIDEYLLKRQKWQRKFDCWCYGGKINDDPSDDTENEPDICREDKVAITARQVRLDLNMFQLKEAELKEASDKQARILKKIEAYNKILGLKEASLEKLSSSINQEKADLAGLNDFYTYFYALIQTNESNFLGLAARTNLSDLDKLSTAFVDSLKPINSILNDPTKLTKMTPTQIADLQTQYNNSKSIYTSINSQTTQTMNKFLANVKNKIMEQKGELAKIVDKIAVLNVKFKSISDMKNQILSNPPLTKKKKELKS